MFRERFLGYVTVRSGAAVASLVRRPIRAWLFAAVAMVILIAGSVMLPQTLVAGADPEPDTPLDCLRCHTRVLKGHDELGAGTEACWACHDSTNMNMLHLADGTLLSSAESAELCGQCHPAYYNAWKGEGHGISSLAGRVNCASCHDPHQPQMALSATTESHPSSLIEPGSPLDCLSCHRRVLKGHDKLGAGTEACWACHYNAEMTTLHLASGETRFPLSEFPRLCAQCHQKRYEEWNEGTHGVPAWKGGEPEVASGERIKCVNCHEPHQPQVVLLNITKPHPLPEPSPPAPPTDLLIILGVSLLVVVAGGIAVVKRGEGP